MAKLKSRLKVENGLVEQSPLAHPPEGIYIARTLVQDRLDIPVRILNATHQEQKLTRGSPLVRATEFIQGSYDLRVAMVAEACEQASKSILGMR